MCSPTCLRLHFLHHPHSFSSSASSLPKADGALRVSPSEKRGANESLRIKGSNITIDMCFDFAKATMVMTRTSGGTETRLHKFEGIPTAGVRYFACLGGSNQTFKVCGFATNLAIATFKAGDVVRVKPEISVPRYGWAQGSDGAAVDHSSIGVVEGFANSKGKLLPASVPASAGFKLQVCFEDHAMDPASGQQMPWFADATDLDVIKAFRHRDEEDDEVVAAAVAEGAAGTSGDDDEVVVDEGAAAATTNAAAYTVDDGLFEVDAAAEAAASGARAPLAAMSCPDCPEPGCGPMSISDGAGHYSSFICNGCRGHGSGDRWFCPTHRNDFCFTCNPGPRPIGLGDFVRVKAGISKPSSGWGSVSAGDVGRVTNVSGASCNIEFNAQSGWSGTLAEMERVEPGGGVPFWTYRDISPNGIGIRDDPNYPGVRSSPTAPVGVGSEGEFLVVVDRVTKRVSVDESNNAIPTPRDVTFCKLWTPEGFTKSAAPRRNKWVFDLVAGTGSHLLELITDWPHTVRRATEDSGESVVVGAGEHVVRAYYGDPDTLWAPSAGHGADVTERVRELAAAATTTAAWEWEDGTLGSGNWKPFDAASTAKIVAAGSGGQCTLSFGRTAYVVDTAALTQTNTNTNYARNIRSTTTSSGTPIVASNDLFGDPCPGTSKLLVVELSGSPAGGSASSGGDGAAAPADSSAATKMADAGAATKLGDEARAAAEEAAARALPLYVKVADGLTTSSGYSVNTMRPSNGICQLHYSCTFILSHSVGQDSFFVQVRRFGFRSACARIVDLNDVTHRVTHM